MVRPQWLAVAKYMIDDADRTDIAAVLGVTNDTVMEYAHKLATRIGLPLQPFEEIRCTLKRRGITDLRAVERKPAHKNTTTAENLVLVVALLNMWAQKIPEIRRGKYDELPRNFFQDIDEAIVQPRKQIRTTGRFT